MATNERKTVREHARSGGALDGADAQALEGALQITERERDDLGQRIEQMQEQLNKMDQSLADRDTELIDARKRIEALESDYKLRKELCEPQRLHDDLVTQIDTFQDAVNDQLETVGKELYAMKQKHNALCDALHGMASSSPQFMEYFVGEINNARIDTAKNVIRIDIDEEMCDAEVDDKILEAQDESQNRTDEVDGRESSAQSVCVHGELLRTKNPTVQSVSEDGQAVSTDGGVEKTEDVDAIMGEVDGLLMPYGLGDGLNAPERALACARVRPVIEKLVERAEKAEAERDKNKYALFALKTSVDHYNEELRRADSAEAEVARLRQRFIELWNHYNNDTKACDCLLEFVGEQIKIAEGKEQ